MNEDAPDNGTRPEPKKIDPEILDAILGKPASVQMTECVDAAEDTTQSVDDREIALDNLEMLIENIDNAANLQPLALWPRLVKLLDDPEPSVRTGVLWVMGTAVQHNPKAQKSFGSNSCLKAVLEVLREDTVGEVRAKALYCVSSYVRANVAGLTEFISQGGLLVLLQAIESAATVLGQKTFFLLRALIDEALDEETPQELRPGSTLVDAIVELGFVPATAKAIQPMVASGESGAVVEQAVMFLAALAGTAKGKGAVSGSAELKELAPKIKQTFADFDIAGLDALL
ncbi:ARM repeat-containing protein [Linderina pennispora]|uniref:ARM repeat-containing protein n=1 Tax=Linderina pennispora TaxID=61395 RepID=A0A1Y1WEI2_9FUNG|nr:ARM repeat-containing protein [Linderina pennispora]ORX71939.1 ARM repeat-containing protein [Linderina pennispora]